MNNNLNNNLKNILKIKYPMMNALRVVLAVFNLSEINIMDRSGS